MSTERTAVRAVCPRCAISYMQELAGEFAGPRRKLRAAEVALRAICEDAGQGAGRDAWVAMIECASCSERRVPPTLRAAVGKWVREGEAK